MSIHRVAQSTRLKMLGQPERQEAFDMVLSILAARFPQQVLGNHMHELWEGCETFLDQVLAFDKAVQRWQPSLLETKVYVNMMCDCTWYLWEIGQHDEALTRLEWLERLCSRTIGLHTLEGARILVNRGCVFSTLNRYEEAGMLFEHALQIRSQMLSGDHPLLANSYMQMGNYYTSLGKVDDAVEAHEKVIQIRLGSPTTTPSSMAVSYFNYCRSLLLCGRFDEAERYLRKAEDVEMRVRDGRERLYCRNHRLYILGNILARRGKIEKALVVHSEAYEIRRDLGVSPYLVGASLHKIGTLYHRLGKRDQAIETFQDAISLLNSFLGPTEAKLARLARTEMMLAEILATGQEAANWRDVAVQHYCRAVGKDCPAEDWSQVDFDSLVPVIDR
ncbi:hypothetical protein MFIFM68171_02666 [Madurella fahalii]|uniref:Tetratricopeptide repeat protein n=1 Tax=Madurella fahalii TaxID=1157608 RepID=A0ABQ0G3W7_9PEZI